MIEYTYYPTPIGELIIGTFEHQLCLLDFRYRKMRQQVNNRLKRYLKTDFIEKNNPIIEQTKNQIMQYLTHQRKTFTLPILLAGTTFQQQVWKTL